MDPHSGHKPVNLNLLALQKKNAISLLERPDAEKDEAGRFDSGNHSDGPSRHRDGHLRQGDVERLGRTERVDHANPPDWIRGGVHAGPSTILRRSDPRHHPAQEIQEKNQIAILSHVLRKNARNKPKNKLLCLIFALLHKCFCDVFCSGFVACSSFS